MELYLITGFLGAGKTTFLKNFARQFGPQNSVFDRLDSNSFPQHLQVSLNGCPTACSPALIF